MNATKIEYLHFTWSPCVGCTGAGCAVWAKCWAKYQAKRRLHKCEKCYAFKPHTHFERLTQPLAVKSTKRIGACFSADFWDKGFNDFDHQSVMHYASLANWHWFINLTKQPHNIPKDFTFPKNWVQGVSVNKQIDLWRIDKLREHPLVLKMISFEPLYEHLGNVNLEGINWIIIGAQTHPLLHVNPDAVLSLIMQARLLKIPIFVKNNIPNPAFQIKEFPAFLQVKPT